MKITLKHKKTGERVLFDHPIDARKALLSGFYSKIDETVEPVVAVKEESPVEKEDLPEGASVASELVEGNQKIMSRGKKNK